MQPTITIDTRPLNAVMREYARLNRRTWAEICNKEALDVAFGALPETPKASKTEIQALPQKEWWPKYLAKRIAKGVSFTIRPQGAGIIPGVKAFKKKFKGKFTRAQAREVSRRIVGARVRSIAFVKSGWLPAIRRLWPLVKDKAKTAVTIGGSRQYGVEKGSAQPAVAGDNPTATITNSAIGVEKIGVAPLQRAINNEIADMQVYIARKMEENARRVAR